MRVVNVIRHKSVLQVLLVLFALSLAACTDGRNATTPGELFHCSADSDCLSGWSCECGYCQQPGTRQFACGVSADDASGDATVSGDTTSDDSLAGDTIGTDATTADTGADIAGTDASTTDTGTPPVGTPIGVCNQSVSSDVVFAACNLATWSGCAADYGCYYGPSIKQTLCKKHTALAENAVCDPCNLTECGLAADSHPMICDAVDKICRRTCDATVPVKAGQCPSGQQCYQLVDSKNVPYPSTGGVCAP